MVVKGQVWKLKAISCKFRLSRPPSTYSALNGEELIINLKFLARYNLGKSLMHLNHCSPSWNRKFDFCFSLVDAVESIIILRELKELLVMLMFSREGSEADNHG